MAREACSAVLVTLNEAARLPACLDTLRFADEILVVDSGSTDDTVAIAERYGARVIHQPWLGYGPQKHYAVEQAAHDWVLCIDADERLTPELRASIEEALTHDRAKACRLTRRNRFLGRWLRHGEGYPDYVVRLFHRAHAQWSDDDVHETVLTDETPLITLHGDLLHESETSVGAYLDKQNRYTDLQAAALFAQGKRAGVAKLLLSPLVRFIKFYVIRLGFLDGLPGLVHILIGCFNSFVKYVKLIQMHRQQTKGTPP
ncbi:glycosyltransferase family 2 protein [Acidihalobacter ferrooxydans]|uniref:Benzoate transporter n=1 Tax=Acidihalobacter ferrooxydans TaxID=1765967 RepID=A0A1P8UE20_9GAMM|nr:glycosyltransferase family 2 protein [Acidihalobacter ferrooxydans]APZ42112.1 benzoate transporter [Acidihalobacter ferrooxydans]